MFRQFYRIDLGRERVPDATTLLKFRHLLEEHKLGAAMFAKVGELLLANRMKLSGGTMFDATLIAAPPSVRNEKEARDPEMHQTKKGNQWHFGMKLHIGADSKTGLIHNASVSSAATSMIATKHRSCHSAPKPTTATAPTVTRGNGNGSR